jgi:hypothetical protein
MISVGQQTRLIQLHHWFPFSLQAEIAPWLSLMKAHEVKRSFHLTSPAVQADYL